MNTLVYHQTPHAKEILDRVQNNPESFTYDEIVNIFKAGNCVVRQVVEENPELIKKLLTKKTPYGNNFVRLVGSGLARPECQIGVYVDGAQTYAEEDYGEFFKKVIKIYHGFDVNTDKHVEDFSNEGLDLADMNENASDKCKVLSVRVRYAFCFDDVPFQSTMTREQRKYSENKLVDVFQKLDGDLAGKYESLETMTPERRQELVDAHILSWTEEDEDLVHARLTDDWPNGRGVFLSNNGELFFLVNDEDNRVGILQQGGDIAKTFRQLGEVNSRVNDNVAIARLPNYGKLASCPTNIGTGMRASALVTLPNMAKQKATLKEIAKGLGLSIRGFYGETSDIGELGETDVSNKARLGISERQIIENVHAGVSILMELERKIAADPENADLICAEYLKNPVDITKKKVEKIVS